MSTENQTENLSSTPLIAYSNSPLDCNEVLPIVLIELGTMMQQGTCSHQFFLSNNDEVFSAYAQNGDLVGFVVWVVIPEIRSVILNLTYVSPKYRGKGLAKQLLTEFETYIKENPRLTSITTISSYINNDNVAMLNLAKATGRQLNSIYTTKVLNRD